MAESAFPRFQLRVSVAGFMFGFLPKAEMVGGSGFLTPAAHYWRHRLADRSAGD
jgi:hypothetical protein